MRLRSFLTKGMQEPILGAIVGDRVIEVRSGSHGGAAIGRRALEGEGGMGGSSHSARSLSRRRWVGQGIY